MSDRERNLAEELRKTAALLRKRAAEIRQEQEKHPAFTIDRDEIRRLMRDEQRH